MGINEIHNLYINHCDSVSINSKDVHYKSMFFALKGTSFDGNQFASDAIENGARYVIIDNPSYYKEDDERHILVDSTLHTLQNLASYHRKKFNFPVLAITGSMGKTTTKELITKVLQIKYEVLSTVGNLNNHLGVPITLLNIKPHHNIAVIEMGASHIGDILELCNIAMPTHGLITTIDKVHLDEFGSYENIVKGKGELYNYLIDSGGVIFIDDTNDTLRKLAGDYNNVVPCDNQLQYISANPYLSYKDNDNIVKTKMVGQHNFLNVKAAFSVGKFFNIDSFSCNKAIMNYISSNNRLQLVYIKDNCILMDAYNANVKSMLNAIDIIDTMDNQNKVLILGDMLGLGEQSDIAHETIVNRTTLKRYDKVIFVGNNMCKFKYINPNAIYFTSKSGLEQYMRNITFTKSDILIKASRVLALESILNLIS